MGNVVLEGTLFVAFLAEVKVITYCALEPCALNGKLHATITANATMFHPTLTVDSFRTPELARTYSFESFAMIAVVDLGALGFSLDGTAIIAGAGAITTFAVIAVFGTFIPIHNSINSHLYDCPKYCLKYCG